jgi:putative transposase
LQCNQHIKEARDDRGQYAAAVRTLCAQPDRQSAGDQLQQVAAGMAGRLPRASAVLQGAEEDALAYMALPTEHCARAYSTNPFERLYKEIKRRTNVVGIFSNVASAERLIGAVRMEFHDKRQVNRRYSSHESMRKLLHPGAPASGPVHWRMVTNQPARAMQLYTT